MKIILFMLVFFTFCHAANSQSIDTVWTKTYILTNNDNKTCAIWDGVKASDGYYYLVGHIADWGSGGGGLGFLVMKVDSAGDTAWTKNISERYVESHARKIIETCDGNFIICGTLRGNGSCGRLRLLKIDRQGNILWKKTYCAEHPQCLDGLCITEAPDSGLIVMGWYWLHQYDHRVFILKTTSAGDSLWLQLYGSQAWNSGRDMLGTNDGGAIIAGYGVDTTEIYDSLWIFRVDSGCSMVWNLKFQIYVEHTFWWPEFIIDNNDGTITVGIMVDWFWLQLYKLGKDGDNLWSPDGVRAPEFFYAADMCSAVDGGYLLTGFYNSKNIAVGKLDSAGDSSWVFWINKGYYDYMEGTFIHQDADGYIFVAGRYSANNAIILAKLYENPLDVAENDLTSLPTDYKLHQNYPNPFNPTTSIEYTIPTRSEVSITIFNLLGREVNSILEGLKSSGTYTTVWDGTNYNGGRVASGIYFYQIRAGDFVDSKKMFLLK